MVEPVRWLGCLVLSSGRDQRLVGEVQPRLGWFEVMARVSARLRSLCNLRGVERFLLGLSSAGLFKSRDLPIAELVQVILILGLHVVYCLDSLIDGLFSHLVSILNMVVFYFLLLGLDLSVSCIVQRFRGRRKYLTVPMHGST